MSANKSTEESEKALKLAAKAADDFHVQDEEILENADPSGTLRAKLVVFGSFLGFIGDFGYINSIGAVQSYLNLHQLKDTPKTHSSLIFSSFLLLTYVWCNAGGVCYDVLGPRIPLIIGTVFIFFGTFFTGSCQTVGQFASVFGILTGVGLGFCSGPLAGTVNSWFAKSNKASTAFALTTVGGSVGGIVFPLILNRLYIVVGFTWALRIFAFVVMALLTLSTILCTDNKETKKNKTQVHSFKDLYHLCAKMVDFRALYKEPAYLLTVIGIALSDLGLTLTLTYFPTYVTFRGYSETKANLCITIINALGILGRYLPGIVADKVGPFNVMIVMLTASCFSIWFLWLVWSLTEVGMVSIYLFSVVYGFFNSSVLSLAPSCIGAVSPTAVFGQRYGTAYLVAGFVIFGGITGGGAMISEETTLHFRQFAIYCGVLYTGSIAAYLAGRYVLVGRKIKVVV